MRQRAKETGGPSLREIGINHRRWKKGLELVRGDELRWECWEKKGLIGGFYKGGASPHQTWVYYGGGWGGLGGGGGGGGGGVLDGRGGGGRICFVGGGVDCWGGRRNAGG